MNPSTADTIILDITDGVAFLTLNRSPLNILTLTMIRELKERLDTASRQTSLKALVLAANGTAFCAGVDVFDHQPERVGPMIREFGALCLQLRSCPLPTIAVVRGAALGGGTELAVACDLVLAGASARFGQPEIKLGVFPPIAAALFPHLIGYQQAARLLFIGETIPARDAAQLGLITFAVADEEVGSRLDQLLNQFRGLSAAALRIAKRALLYGTEQGVERALPWIEDLYLTDLMVTSDADEGIRAFIEKRRPTWRDR
jgi:cyclohexa-1,5-dienecarbonyl-CoA hydratase